MGKNEEEKDEKQKKELTLDARVLPFNLADSLLALPSRPTPPILLLVTGICILLGIMVHAFSLSDVGSCRRPDSQTKIVDRCEDCPHINESELKGRSRGPHFAFSFLVGAGSIISIAAAVVERRSVNAALEAWKVRAGASVGLEARMGVLAHCKSLTCSFLSPHLTPLSRYPCPDTLVLIWGPPLCASTNQ